MGGNQSVVMCKKCKEQIAVHRIQFCEYVDTCLCQERVCTCRYESLKREKIDKIVNENKELSDFIKIPIYNHPRIGKIMIEAYGCKNCVGNMYSLFDEYEEKGFKK